MAGLGNTQIGGPNGSPGRLVDQRFRAITSSQLASVQLTFPNFNSGYCGGTGGSLAVTIQSDNGSGLASGTVLARTNLTNLSGSYGTPPGGVTNWPVVTFATPATLAAGNLYHVVMWNTDPNPSANFVSIDAIYNNTPIQAPLQPRFGDGSWGLLYRDSSWVLRPDYSPIMGLAYANGAADGLAYVYSDIGSPRTISGSSVVRETFTVSGSSRSVSSVAVRLKRVSGSDPLTIRLTDGGGTVIDTATIASTSLSTSIDAAWATASFASAHTLSSGATYNVVLSAPASSSYSIFAPYEGSTYGHFNKATYFADGRAQYSTGGAWYDWGGRADHDLEFYLR